MIYTTQEEFNRMTDNEKLQMCREYKNGTCKDSNGNWCKLNHVCGGLLELRHRNDSFISFVVALAFLFVVVILIIIGGG